jgi:hypothetical protein
MDRFWDGFEKTALNKEAVGLLGLGLGGSAALAGAAHLGPNMAALKLMKNKRFAEHIGDHFSSGLFNTPVSRMGAFGRGAAAAIAPEYPIMAMEAREIGNKMREHLVSRVHHFGTKASVGAARAMMGGDVTKAHMLDPHTAGAMLEFANQHQINPLVMGIELKKLFKDPNHPLLSNMLPNMIRLPRRKITGVGADMPQKWVTKAPGAAMDEGALNQMSEEFTSPLKSKIKKMFTPAKTEEYLPDVDQLTGAASPARRGWTHLGAASAIGSEAMAEPLTGAVNAAKYTYFGTPLRKFVKGLKNDKLRLNALDESMVSKPMEGAFHKGLVENKPIHPVKDWFHKNVINAVQGETLGAANALGRAGASAIPPQHRKAVYENLVGAMKGVPGSFQAKMPNPPLGEQLAPLALPAAAAGVLGAGGYMAGKKKSQEGRPQMSAAGNIKPLMGPPPQMQMPQQSYGG